MLLDPALMVPHGLGLVFSMINMAFLVVFRNKHGGDEKEDVENFDIKYEGLKDPEKNDITDTRTTTTTIVTNNNINNNKEEEIFSDINKGGDDENERVSEEN